MKSETKVVANSSSRSQVADGILRDGADADISAVVDNWSVIYCAVKDWSLILAQLYNVKQQRGETVHHKIRGIVPVKQRHCCEQRRAEFTEPPGRAG